MTDLFIEYLSDAHGYYLIIFLPLAGMTISSIWHKKLKLGFLFGILAAGFMSLVIFASNQYEQRFVPQYRQTVAQGDAKTKIDTQPPVDQFSSIEVLNSNYTVVLKAISAAQAFPIGLY